MKTDRYIRYEKEFDAKFEYTGRDLGVSCKEEGTIFKVWCPLADRVTLHLYTDDATESCRTCELAPQEKGIWMWETTECLHGMYYDYAVDRDGETTTMADPYAIACGCNGVRSMVVDLSRTNPEGFENDKAPVPQSETVIYELHIKDFSYDPDSGIPEEYRGKYKAFTVQGANGNYPTCVEYLKELGITHVHLLPAYDFGSVDEAGDSKQFNWGYDPLNYNVPEGSYATDPHDGTIRIREFKEMVQALHQNGIRVVMDVVYNHTYSADSWLERMVPGYYNRRNPDGTLANGSCCGSDMAAGRAMVDNYIVDSVLYWAREYHIDGFRFDLMGLLTVELMNRIREELDAVYGKGEKLLYGEPWRGDESPMEPGTTPALKANVAKLADGIAVFCDATRDVIKGHVFYEEEPGFVNGATGLEKQVLDATNGWVGSSLTTEGFAPRSCSQVVNYTSAHDNYTLWDKLVITMHGAVGKNNEYCESAAGPYDEKIFTERFEDVVSANKLAAMMYFTFQGYIFLQAGEEFGRTKLGDSNSFRSEATVNMLRWHQTVEYADLLSYYKGLIRLRKKLPGLCDKSAKAGQRITERTVHSAGVVSFRVDNRVMEGKHTSGEGYDKLWIAYNASDKAAELSLPEGEWVILADGQEADCRKQITFAQTEAQTCQLKDRIFAVPAMSGMILAKIDS